MKFFRRSMKRLLGLTGYELVRKGGDGGDTGTFPADFEQSEIDDYLGVAPYTITGPLRVVSLFRAINYLQQHRIPGDFVECGVWKGGSVMAMARTLLRDPEPRRHLWLYDTFAGMSTPTDRDTSVCNRSAQEDYEASWLCASLDDVRRAVLSVGYDEEQITFVMGKVEDTIPDQIPETIALLRLDTDWYESTRHELIYLFPRLVPGGVLIIDDYGHWRGARQATDEYFQEHGIQMLLNRIDFSARIGVKR